MARTKFSTSTKKKKEVKYNRRRVYIDPSNPPAFDFSGFFFLLFFPRATSEKKKAGGGGGNAPVFRVHSSGIKKIGFDALIWTILNQHGFLSH